MIDYDRVEQLAYKTLEKSKVKHFPVDLNLLCSNEGLKINPISSNDISGRLDRKGKIIEINRDDSSLRQRFTCAHELGHYILHSDNDIMYRDSVYSKDKDELEANHFAACILMPEKQFRQAFSALNGSINALSSRFGVSRPAIAFRSDFLSGDSNEYFW